jgi:hypothetical protein
LEHLRGGGVAAVVFESLPYEYKGFPVVDGDERDDLMLDVKGGTILGLRAKGKARKDRSGFVVTNDMRAQSLGFANFNELINDETATYAAS